MTLIGNVVDKYLTLLTPSLTNNYEAEGFFYLSVCLFERNLADILNADKLGLT